MVKKMSAADTYDAKLHELQKWQRTYNMIPRQDSRLTELFCSGQLPSEWTAPLVARELVATDFIYKNTLYGEMVEEFMRIVAADLRRKYRISWAKTWEIVRFYGPPALKLLCLERCGLAIPDLSTTAVG